MQLREVIGRRRSIRFLLPHQPVELDKIQRMLEAARLASHWGNVNSLRAIVIERDKASQEVLDALPSPVGGDQIQLAPVVIVWYIETAATDQVGHRLRELVNAGAIGYGPNKRTVVEKTLVPLMESAGDALKMPGLGEVDCGQGIAQATLMAFEQGLGTCCLGTGDPDGIRRTLGLPDTCRVLVTQTVGYPAVRAREEPPLQTGAEVPGRHRRAHQRAGPRSRDEALPAERQTTLRTLHRLGRAGQQPPGPRPLPGQQAAPVSGCVGPFRR